MNTNELVERLRAERDRMWTECRLPTKRTCVTATPDMLGQAAATIAALTAELARAKEDGVRLGIEVAAKDAAEWFPEVAYQSPRIKFGVVASIRNLDPASIIRAQAMDDLIAADADMIDYVPVADSDGDDGA